MSAQAGTSSSSVTMPEGLDVDAIIEKLLEVRGSRPGRQVNLSEVEIRGLCTAARDIFMQQPVLLELEAPIKICGTTTRAPSTALSLCCPHLASAS